MNKQTLPALNTKLVKKSSSIEIKQPITLDVRAIIKRLYSINTLEQTFEVFFFTELTHKGTFDLDKTEQIKQEYAERYMDRIEFPNCEEIDLKSSKVEVYEDEVRIRNDWKGVFCESMELHAFPYDAQQLTITMGLTSSNKDEFPAVLVQSKTRKSHINMEGTTLHSIFTISNKVELQGWDTGIELSAHKQSYPRLDVSIFVARKSAFYVWNVVLPMAVMVIMASMSFVVDRRDVADRLSVSLTLVLTAAAYKYVVAEMLPSVNYITLLDSYVLGCSGLISLIVIQNGLMGMEMATDEMETISFWVLTGLGFLLHAVYAWGWYKATGGAHFINAAKSVAAVIPVEFAKH